MRLILVRHGQTPSNVGGLLDTAEPGADLTALGHRQAHDLVDTLRDERIDVVVTSTLVRTQQTAAPIARARGLAVVVRPGIREIRAGELEMLGDERSVAVYLRTAFAWSAGDLGVRMPGGEDGHEVYGRYDAVVAEAAALAARAARAESAAGSANGAAWHADADDDARPPTALLVSHGAVIRSWSAAHADNLTVEQIAPRPLPNTGVVILEGAPGSSWTAVSWEGAPVPTGLSGTGGGVDHPGGGRPGPLEP